MGLDLPRQRQPALATRAPVKGYLHGITMRITPSHFDHNHDPVKGQLDESQSHPIAGGLGGMV